MRRDLVRCAGVAQQAQQYLQGFGHGHQGLGPAHQVLAPAHGQQLLPVVVGRQVELAGAARDADTAADAHQPFIARQRSTGLAVQGVEALERTVDAADGLVQSGLVDAWAAAVGNELGLVLLELFQQIALQVGARSDVQDLEEGDQREMVIQRGVALQQRTESVEQVFEAKHRADALVERVLVQDHSGDFSQGAVIVSQPQRAARLRTSLLSSLSVMPSLSNTASATARRAWRDV
mmetsp:Transcript_20611/g.38475  ORF Transcript_20611/g.38475 Transcript_20611/m.38475 type:complete len:235 (-) Transcript_20611:219-923(-)